MDVSATAGLFVTMLLLFITFGLAAKFIRFAISIFALPVYAGLYFVETLFIRRSEKNSIFKLSLPTTPGLKMLVDFSASIMLLSLLFIVDKLEIWKAIHRMDVNTAFSLIMKESLSAPPILFVFIALSFVIIYSISCFFTDSDERSGWEKLESLRFLPSLKGGLLE